MSNKSNARSLGQPSSIIVVVKDLEKSATWATSMWGIRSWELFEYSPSEDEIAVGGPFRLKVAMAQLGGLILELIQPLEGRTIWSEFLENRGGGIFSMSFEVRDWEKTVTQLEANGNKIVAAATWEGKRWCVFDPGPEGIIFQLVEHGSAS